MIIAVIKEIKPNEKRVALTPDVVSKLQKLGFSIRIEQNAGLQAGFKDEEYLAAGAEIFSSAQETCKKADFLFKIWAPLPQEDKLLSPNMTVIAHFQALSNVERIKKFAELGITAFAMDLMPRISRAQSMDILSSQSNLAGYRAVIEAIENLNKAVPMMMTAAGTVAPAKVLVLGAGVAGLQAIATAKRLGAQVYASDVRPQVKEQVESLGGKFIEINTQENFETTSGYAKETSEEYKKKQHEAVAEQLKKTDIAITTALIPGKKAPILIDKEMIKAMPQGAVIIDMATESGGNVEGSQDNQIISINGVKIIGNSNFASELPYSASKLFAQNIFNFILPMYNTQTQQIEFNFNDELIKGTCICKDKKIQGVIK